jgi:aminoglycoside 6-adenylyltransferase
MIKIKCGYENNLYLMVFHIMKTEQEIIDVFINFAKGDERIRAVYLHGSRANPNAPKDKYSDYDIVYVASETGSFIDNKEWLNEFGDIIFCIEAYRVQNIFFGREVNDLTRRIAWSMLFADGSRVDLVVEIIKEAMNHNHIRNKPAIILLDKDGCLPEMLPLYNEKYNEIKPNEDEYMACCSGFWWFLTNIAKGIARDHLPYAKEEFNSKTLVTLNRMIEWYIGVQTNFSVSAGRKGNYYKKYLPVDMYDLYTKIYSDGNYENFWNALFSACELFSKIASGVGEYFGFIYNKQEENSMIGYLIKMKNEI